MSTQSILVKWFVLLVIGLLWVSGTASAQALTVMEVDHGVWLVDVTLPMADATTLAWQGTDGSPRTITAGGLTLASDLAQLGAALPESAAVPAIVVAVGQAAPDELRSLLEDTLRGRAVAAPPRIAERPPVDGSVDRRLGPPGDSATLRLELALPPPEDSRRAAAEVLWQLVTGVVGGGVSARVVGERAVLEGHVEAAAADHEIQRWRLALARFAEAPELDAAHVEAARRRVAVRRQAVLAEHPDGAITVLDAYARGGEDGVRQLLFGTEGVTTASVREVAHSWLGARPGAVVVAVPPQVLNPRFATPPARAQLANDLAVAVLERPASPLAAIVLRPVLTPDVDGSVAATVLARIAAEMRADPDSVAGWIRAERQPARLELAAMDDAFGELIEGLQTALDVVAQDDGALGDMTGDARSAALALTAELLGVRSPGPFSPADLLRPDNLALGVVAADGEAALEALRKFRFGGSSSSLATGSPAGSETRRTRVVAAGARSCLAIVLPVVGGEGDLATRAAVVAALLTARAGRVAAGLAVTTLRPLVPGREVIVLLVEAERPVDELEHAVRSVWSAWLAAPDEDELTVVRRLVAAAAAASGSGAVGRARLVAEVAAGASGWRTPAERELAILTVARSEVVDDLGRMGDFEHLVTAGAGVLPLRPRTAEDAVP